MARHWFEHPAICPWCRSRRAARATCWPIPALLDLAQDTGVDLWLSGLHHAFHSGRAVGILFVAQAALGNRPRKLIGEAEVTARGFTWIDIGDGGKIVVTAYPAPGLVTTLEADDLPPTPGTGPFRPKRAHGRTD
ncbi:hypothetical protein LAZ29_11395 [Cereibacter sphaeroides]|uniref:hypothetical protein n=1 Tax=Cereibacter sphaeroides TaxID=1063 RepID=UPI001F26F733|nr:hypothetical protein [Cereibacter sphaeroides]MCE6951537.1 hypothetical protein [Cereibacter sphaeroides]